MNPVRAPASFPVQWEVSVWKEHGQRCVQGSEVHGVLSPLAACGECPGRKWSCTNQQAVSSTAKKGEKVI